MAVFENQRLARDLAYLGSLKDEVLDMNEICLAFLEVVSKKYPKLVVERYKLDALEETPLAIYEQIAKSRGFLLRGGEVDYDRTALAVIDDFRKHRLGKLCWKHRLRNRTMDDLLKFEKLYLECGCRYICGVDEVGRGPLAGPVTVTAIIMDFAEILEGVNDSKKVTEKRREALYDKILANSVAYKTVCVDNKVIDEINILNATKQAMETAI